MSVQEPMPDTTKPKVLVADDERVIADTLAMILNQSGFQARAVYSGEKALELAPEFKPDMLISDVIMADLNGIDAAIRIRALLPVDQDSALLRPGRYGRPAGEGSRPRATTLRSWPNPFIRRIYSPSCAA